jgi:hypothetical protein
MTPKSTTMLVLALLSAGTGLFAGLSVARAGELTDRGANRAPTNSRIDQLAKPAGPQDDQPTLDRQAPGGTSGAGSFPRSFLIPGTSTSVRIGGSIDATTGYR